MNRRFTTFFCLLCFLSSTLFPWDILAAESSAKTEISDSVSSIEISGEYAEGRVLLSLVTPSETSLTKEGKTSFDSAITIEQSYPIGNAGDLLASSEDSLETEFLEDKTFYVTEATSDTYSTKELIGELQNKAYVVEVSPDYKQYLSETEPYEKEQWYLDGTGSYDSEGSGISHSSLSQDTDPDGSVETDAETPVIAVMDTGINYNHEDLADHMWENTISSLSGKCGYNFADNSVNCMDVIGHGTHCAGIIAASQNQKGIKGISNARLMALKIFNDKEECYDSYIIDALNYLMQAKDAGVPIVAVNCSWGGGSSSTSMKTLMRSLGQKGILFVFAAGNDNVNQDTATAECPYDLYDTSAYSDLRNYILTVGASTTSDTAASFSDYGKNSVDLFAPGENIVSTYIADTYFPELYQGDTKKNTELTSLYQSFDEKTSVSETYSDKDVGVSSSTSAKMSFDSENDFYGQASKGCLSWEISMGFPSFRQKQSNLYIDVTDLNLNPTDEFYVSMMFGSDDADDGNISWQHVTKHSYGSLGSENNRFYESSDGRLFFRIIGLVVPGSTVGKTTIYLDNIGISTANPDISQFGQYELLSGTSMAAPMVSGALGLCAQYYPNEDAYNRRNRLLTCVRVKDSMTSLCITGGLLDLSTIHQYVATETPDLTPEEVPDSVSSLVPESGQDSSSQENLSTPVPTVAPGTTKSTVVSTTLPGNSQTAKSSVKKIKKITFKKKIKTLRSGHSYQLKIKYTPSTATKKKVSWSSSKKKWATVSSSGVVRAKKQGIGHTVRITAKAKDGSKKKASLRIKIKK